MVSDYCKKWIEYAQNDIRIATQEMGAHVNPRHRAYEAILYHCQQGAEKMFKAYLLCNGVTQWGHDLEVLRMACTSFDKSFNSIRLAKHCAYLGLFVAARYPDFKMASVDANNAGRAINSAKRVFDFVSVRLGLGEMYFKVKDKS